MLFHTRCLDVSGTNVSIDSVSKQQTCVAKPLQIQEIADELHRLCSVYEAESGNGQTNGSRLEIEQHITERFAKSNGLWIPIDSIFNLGVPGPSGNENDTYVVENTIFKVNNLFNTGSITGLLSKVATQ